MTDAQPSTAERRIVPTLGIPSGLVLLALLLIITLPYSLYASGPETLPGDIWLLRQVQSIESETLETLGDGLDWIGTGRGLATPAAILAGWLAWRRWWGYALLILVSPAIASLISGYLKDLLASPRPTFEFARITGDATGLGYPSGHAMRAIIFFGLIWIIATRLIDRGTLRHIVQAFALLMVLVSGFARMYIGVHWPSDVLGGYLWGAIVLGLLVIGYDFIAARNVEIPIPRGRGRDEAEPEATDR